MIPIKLFGFDCIKQRHLFETSAFYCTNGTNYTNGIDYTNGTNIVPITPYECCQIYVKTLRLSAVNYFFTL